MPSWEWSLWLAFNSKHRLVDGVRQDYRHALTSWACASANGAKVKPEDFIPRFTAKANNWKAAMDRLYAIQCNKAK